VPHFAERLAEIRRWLVDDDVTPDLADDDRRILVERLKVPGRVQAAPEQLLHGEPHPWNVLVTPHGLRFIDFENCARGPIEYDLAWVPDDVSRGCAEADQELVGECRSLVLALIAAHRWHRDDQHPSGRASGGAFLDVLRAGPPWPAIDEVQW
jgi:aminoglycoside phosphotransferase (APT) family kinase protein